MDQPRLEIAPGAPRADLEEGLRQVHALQRPAPDREISNALGALRVVLRSRAVDASDLKATLKIYLQYLGDLPGDVLLYHLAKMIETEEFFPTVAELRTRCAFETERRQAVADALVRALEAAP